MYKKRNSNCATKQICGGPQSSHSLVVALLCALSLSCSFACCCLQQNERKKESERGGENKSTASPPPPHTHTFTITTSHTYILSHSLFILIVLCGDCCCTACLLCVGKHPVQQGLPLSCPSCAPPQWRSQVADSHSQCDATQVLKSPSSLCMGHKKLSPVLPLLPSLASFYCTR